MEHKPSVHKPNHQSANGKMNSGKRMGQSKEPQNEKTLKFMGRKGKKRQRGATIQRLKQELR